MSKDLWKDMIDESIKIDVQSLPKSVQELIKELEDIHENEKDWLKYDLKFDELDVVSKSYILNNRISESTYKKIIAKYGGIYD